MIIYNEPMNQVRVNVHFFYNSKASSSTANGLYGDHKCFIQSLRIVYAPAAPAPPPMRYPAPPAQGKMLIKFLMVVRSSLITNSSVFVLQNKIYEMIIMERYFEL